MMISSKSDNIKNRILEFSSLLSFIYKDVECDIDPFNPRSYHLRCGNKEKDVASIDEVMTLPFFCGKSLDEIAGEIEITDW